MTDAPIITLRMQALESFDASTLPPEQHHRIDVVTPRAVLPFLVVRKMQADTVLVLSNGAVNQERARHSPVFQRSSWSGDIRHHQIYFYDPGTGAPEFLPLAWGQLGGGRTVMADAVWAIKRLSRSLGVAKGRKRVYFGSSAGGFLALSMSARDPNSRAIINNAQFDWTRWMPDAVNALRAAKYDNQLPTDLRERYPLATNVLNVIADRRTSLRVQYFVNLASKHDLLVDYPMFQDFVLEHPELCRDVSVSLYFDSRAGHNPLAKEPMLVLLNGSSNDA